MIASESNGASNHSRSEHDHPSSEPPVTGFRSMAWRLHGEQQDRDANAARALSFHNGFLDDTLKAILPNDLILVGAFPGAGKCLAPETLVMRFDGSTVRASEVAVGDLLMGPDSRPRRVLSTTTGRGEMFEIAPVKGEPWRCNDVHVLTLRHTITEDVIDIPLDEYLAKGDGWKTRYKLFSTSVDYAPAEPLPLSPYFLGVWFGDGSKYCNSHGLAAIRITKPDAEILLACNEIAEQFDLRVSTTVDARTGCPTHQIARQNGSGDGGNRLLDLLRVITGRYGEVPTRYLRASRVDRLAFLAGWLDTDGYLAHGNFEIVQKRSDWADAIQQLATSLGFRVSRSVKTVNDEPYQRMLIMGNTDEIPTRIRRKQATPRKQIKNVQNTGFSVAPVGMGDYAGFTLDGDGRFLLSDFTVTHNTAFVLGIAAANAMLGKRVHYFALEAEPRELERRTKFAKLSAYAHRDKKPTANLTYSNWMLRNCEDVIGEYNAIVDTEMRDKLSTLYTYYRGARFDYTDLQRQILAVADDTDLIVVDHLHYVDPKDDASESRAIGDIVHAIRDCALRVGKPVILVAHLRKPERTRGTPIMPDLFDFHGSGEIGKVATQAILFDRAWAIDPSKWYLAPTFIRAAKDRRDGDSGLVALCQFDTRTKGYQGHYTLGKQSWSKGGATWEPLEQHKVPAWARHHRPLETT